MKPLNLVVVAHPDDEILGFGATGAKLVQAGETVQVVILSGQVDARTQRPASEELTADILKANGLLGFNPPILGSFPNIQMNTVPHLELVQFIELQIMHFRPYRVFTHHTGDLNDDHLQVARACLAASRLAQRTPAATAPRMILTMEIPSSTDWAYAGTHTPFSPTHFVEVGAEGVDRKIKALECYHKVMRPFPHSRSREVLTSLAACRGAQAGVKYAEAFQVVFQQEL